MKNLKQLLEKLIQSQKNSKQQTVILGLALLIAGTGAIATPVAAQIAPASDGVGTKVNANGDRLDISGGRTSLDGANLFHSFQRFGLSQGQIANFLSNPAIRNILGRVVGGDASYINGLIQVTGGKSNLFLMNPAGIVFGPNASLNVPASFTATTATGIGFNAGWFKAVGDNNWADLVGTPSAFALGATHPGIIANFGNLAVSGGNNLSLIGGSVQNYGTLSSPGGKITLAAVPESNLVRISQEGHLLSLEVVSGNSNPQSLSEMLTGGNVSHATNIVTNPDGTIQLTASSGYLLNEGQISATGATGGEINLNGRLTYNLGEIDADGTAGGRIGIETRNLLDAGKISAIATAGKGGEITLNYTGTVIQTSSATTNVSGARQGGNILFNGGAGSVLTTSGSFSATGDKGGSIRLFGQDLRLLAASINASGNFGGGEILIGGDLQGRSVGAINAQNTFVNPASTLSADALNAGDGGRIIVWSDRQTTFAGTIAARGGTEGGNGGFAEVSGKDTLFMSGTADMGAAKGAAGTLLLDPKNIIIDDTTATFPSFELTDPNPNDTGFGTAIAPLSTGNVVVTDPNDNFAATNAGAVYLFNGATGALISTLTGTTAGDGVGSGSVNVRNGVTALSNGNYVVNSLSWDNGAIVDAGAVTWGNGSTGITGAVSAANSLVGTTANDRVGIDVTALSNGNYVVNSYYWDNGAATDAGAVTWGNGSTGITGAVSAANSLVGTTANDTVGSRDSSYGGITALSNGNYVVRSPFWDNGAIVDAGAVTWGNGSTGITGALSAANSLVGTTANDRVGSDGITALSNGNYVVNSRYWKNGAVTNAGAVTWGNGSTGITGAVSAANSLVGTTTDDQVGSYGVTALSNGNYVVSNPLWDNGAIVDAGAVTWGNGSTGITGAISAANSLVGTTANDRVGSRDFFFGGVTALSNGNYVVSSSGWNNGAATAAGAVTWGNGSTGITGAVSAANSLVGTTTGDNVGRGGVTALSNGNYVVSSYFWDNGAATDAGAVTWGNGSTGITGAVSAANSLVGTTADDRVSYNDVIVLLSITALSNGNYVVNSPYWDNGAAKDAGAVTWGNGSTGITGAVSAANSLVGTTANEKVGIGSVVGDKGTLSAPSVTALSNGNYVVYSPYSNGGAVTWGNGSTGITGAISAANSLVGTKAYGSVTNGGVTALSNGNYVVRSSYWDNGAAYSAGAVTWGNGTTGITGAISAANSLVGTTANDYVGGGITVLSNGNYVVHSYYWDNGAATDAGAATWVNGATGQTINNSNLVSLQNSFVGKAAGTRFNGVVENTVNGTFLAVFPRANQVSVGFVDPNPNLLTFARGQDATVTIASNFLTRTLNAGTAVVLQANNDITVNSPIITNNPVGNGGDLTLQAGRSLLVNANIITDNGNLTLTGNNPLASGVVNAYRDAGNAVISTASGTTLDSGTGNAIIKLDTGAGLTNKASRNITLAGTINANNLTVENSGTRGGAVNIPATGMINLAGNLVQNAPSRTGVGGSITTASNPIQLNDAVTLNGNASINTGCISFLQINPKCVRLKKISIQPLKKYQLNPKKNEPDT